MNGVVVLFVVAVAIAKIAWKFVWGKIELEGGGDIVVRGRWPPAGLN